MEQILIKLNEGGAIFTYPILAITVGMAIYFAQALLKKRSYSSTENLITNFSWLSLGWGNVGIALGLIVAFDSIKTTAICDFKLQHLAGGLKMVFICFILSAFTFTLNRLFILILCYIRERSN
ncbi:hypothetical protein [Saccharicrinis aurantiacus]|uniref:hypothetical protein n=1 Tax=Saccharicrinis aurantiacus TaxID=1849719 RepID=UPI0024933C1D|nr:hypothetical protein [Saccharicrinis aurantiacus]